MARNSTVKSCFNKKRKKKLIQPSQHKELPTLETNDTNVEHTINDSKIIPVMQKLEEKIAN